MHVWVYNFKPVTMWALLNVWINLNWPQTKLLYYVIVIVDVYIYNMKYVRSNFCGESLVIRRSCLKTMYLLPTCYSYYTISIKKNIFKCFINKSVYRIIIITSIIQCVSEIPWHDSGSLLLRPYHWIRLKFTWPGCSII